MTDDEECMQNETTRHTKKELNDPDDYLVGREDGTVWVGSDSSYHTF